MLQRRRSVDQFVHVLVEFKPGLVSGSTQMGNTGLDESWLASVGRVHHVLFLGDQDHDQA